MGIDWKFFFYLMDSVYFFLINKMRNGGERKKRGFYWRGFVFEIGLM